jgi:hypothetical protein
MRRWAGGRLRRGRVRFQDGLCRAFFRFHIR